jgi:CheY-like chemotaxis protein
VESLFGQLRDAGDFDSQKRQPRPDSSGLVMPDMDGVATLSQLRQHDELAAIPVIFISATMQPDQATNYVELGARGLISKPCDPRKLPDEIARIMGSRK